MSPTLGVRIIDPVERWHSPIMPDKSVVLPLPTCPTTPTNCLCGMKRMRLCRRVCIRDSMEILWFPPPVVPHKKWRFHIRTREVCLHCDIDLRYRTQGYEDVCSQLPRVPKIKPLNLVNNSDKTFIPTCRKLLVWYVSLYFKLDSFPY